LNQGFLVVKLKSHKHISVAIVTWLVISEYLVPNDGLYVLFVVVANAVLPCTEYALSPDFKYK